jgi:hypothetical protein
VLNRVRAALFKLPKEARLQLQLALQTCDCLQRKVAIFSRAVAGRRMLGRLFASLSIKTSTPLSEAVGIMRRVSPWSTVVSSWTYHA